MTSKQNAQLLLTNRSMPSSIVIPVLQYANVEEAVNWLCAAFGFAVRLRIPGHRVQLHVGGVGAVVVGESSSAAASTASASGSIMVRVANVDEHFAMAKSAGAQTLSTPTTFPFGERQYSVVDLGGHVWTFSQSVSDVDPSSWGGILIGKEGEAS